MTGLRISPQLALPIEVAGEAIAILAKRGAGKTNTATVLVEELAAAGVQVVILDPVGAWWGLRSSSDGKDAGLPIPILGGQHGDVPLEHTAGAVIADAAVDHRASLLLDLSDFSSKEQMRRFVTDFAERLFRRKARDASLLHLVLEEADTFAPQNAGRRDDGRMQAAIEQIVRRGRSRGLGATLITQRSAVLSKDVLTQADVLVVMRTTGPHDLAAIKQWVASRGDDHATEILDSLPSLATGEAWIWNPERDLAERVTVRPRETFDSSSTPKAGQTRVEPKGAAAIDLEALGEQIAATAEKAKASDPAVLQKRVRELEQQLKAAPRGEPERVEVQVPVEVPVLEDEQVELLQSIVGEIRDVAEAVDALRAVADQIESALRAARPRAEQVRTERVRPAAPAAAQTPARRPAPPAADTDLSAYAVGLIRTLGERHPMRLTRAQISTFSGRKPRSSAFSAAMAEIARGGYVTVQGGQHALTDAGLAVAGDSVGAATGDVIEMWRAALPAYERDLLDALVEAHPQGVTRPELAETTGRSLTSSAFSAAISTLAKNGLAEVSGGEVRASSDLFIAAPA